MERVWLQIGVGIVPAVPYVPMVPIVGGSKVQKFNGSKFNVRLSIGVQRW
jgi:hypothetical protein